MQRKFSLLPAAIALFMHCNASAQQPEPGGGYVVTTQGDTLRGIVQDKNWNKNPRTIGFRTSPQAPSRLYSAHQLRSFATASGEQYESHVVSVDKTPEQISDLSIVTTPASVTDTVFLMVCVKGNKSLYFLKDEQEKNHFYLQNAEGPLEELILRRLIREQNGAKVLALDERYKKQLETALADCPAVRPAIARTLYGRNALQKLILRYNQCGAQPAPVKFAAAPQKVKLDLGFLLGGSLTNLQFKGDAPRELTIPTFSSPLGYTLGLSLELILPRNHGRWAFYNELRWRSYRATATYQDYRSAENYTNSRLTFDLSYATLVNMLRYRFGTGAVRPFINVGILNALALKVKNEQVAESTFFTTNRVEIKKAIGDFRKYEQGLVLGLGAGWKRSSAELRYELGNGMSEYQTLTSRTNTLSLLLSYRLK